MRSVFIEQSATMQKGFSDTSGWVILSPIEARIKEKIEAVGVPLKNWDIKIYRGILTGYNEAFIIDEDTKNKLIDASPKNAEIIRPIIRGREVAKHAIENLESWIIFIPWHFPLHENPGIVGASKESEIIFEQTFPAIYQHLLSHKDNLSNRNKAETGIRYEWYAMQRLFDNYLR